MLRWPSGGLRRRAWLPLYSCRCYAALELFETLGTCVVAFCNLGAVLLTLNCLLGLSSVLLFDRCCGRVTGFGVCNLTSSGGLRCHLLRLGLSQGLDRSRHLGLLLIDPRLETVLHIQELV